MRKVSLTQIYCVQKMTRKKFNKKNSRLSRMFGWTTIACNIIKYNSLKIEQILHSINNNSNRNREWIIFFALLIFINFVSQFRYFISIIKFILKNEFLSLKLNHTKKNSMWKNEVATKTVLVHHKHQIWIHTHTHTINLTFYARIRSMQTFFFLAIDE